MKNDKGVIERIYYTHYRASYTARSNTYSKPSHQHPSYFFPVFRFFGVSVDVFTLVDAAAGATPTGCVAADAPCAPSAFNFFCCCSAAFFPSFAWINCMNIVPKRPVTVMNNHLGITTILSYTISFARAK
jgi:hypothetical protein